MPVPEPPADNLTDDDLQSEIELVGELVVAATGSEGPLPQSEIDRLLGVAPVGAGANDRAAGSAEVSETASGRGQDQPGHQA